VNEWTEFAFAPHAARYRWRCIVVDEYHHFPRGLELQRWEGDEVGWKPIANTNVLDAFKLGFSQAVQLQGDPSQTELSL